MDNRPLNRAFAKLFVIENIFRQRGESFEGYKYPFDPSFLLFLSFLLQIHSHLPHLPQKTNSSIYHNLNIQLSLTIQPPPPPLPSPPAATGRMTKPNNFPREKDRALPWSKGLPIFNTATGMYEKPTRKSSVVRPTTEPRPKSRSETSAVAAGSGLSPRPVSSEHPGDKKRKRGAGVSFVPPKKRRFVRQKNGGLADDFPTVLFPGVPMAIAMRKTEELKEEFPGVPLTVALEKKTRRKAAPAAKTTTTTTTTTAEKKAAQEPRRKPTKGPAEKGKKEAPPSDSKAAVSANTGSGYQPPVFKMTEFFGHGKKQAQLPEKKKEVQAGGERGKKRKMEGEGGENGAKKAKV